MSTATRTAIVTGGAQGIGRAIVARLARDGMQVVIADRNEDAAEQTAAGIAGAGTELVGASRISIRSRR